MPDWAATDSRRQLQSLDAAFKKSSSSRWIFSKKDLDAARTISGSGALKFQRLPEKNRGGSNSSFQEGRRFFHQSNFKVGAAEDSDGADDFGAGQG